MISEKIKTAKQVLTDYPITATDSGGGEFLNIVFYKYLGMSNIDFNTFSTGSWLRTRRKVLEKFPELDRRTAKTIDVEAKIKNELKSI